MIMDFNLLSVEELEQLGVQGYAFAIENGKVVCAKLGDKEGVNSIEIPKFSNRFYSNRQEKKIAKVVGGKQTANSGATKWSKGDVTTDQFLLEAKTKTKPSKSFTLQKEWFDKNKEEAFAMNKPYSALVFDFGDGEQHYVIDEKLFLVLKNYLEEN